MVASYAVIVRLRRELSMDKLTTKEIVSALTGGKPELAPAAESRDPLHGIPEAIGTSEDFPLTHRPGEYMGISRETSTGTGDDATAPTVGGPNVREAMIQEMNDVTRQVIANAPDVPRQDPNQPIQSPLTYKAVEHHSTPEGVEQTVRMVEIHRQINQASAAVTGPDVPFGGDQPAPTPNRYPAIQDLVMDDLARRKALGILRYGTPLQPHNGRDALRDAYEEAIDLTQYLRQAIFERDEQ